MEPCESCLEWDFQNWEAPTNADKIRSMTDEELAEFLDRVDSTNMISCKPMGCASKKHCLDCWLEWLTQPLEESK